MFLFNMVNVNLYFISININEEALPEGSTVCRYIGTHCISSLNDCSTRSRLGSLDRAPDRTLANLRFVQLKVQFFYSNFPECFRSFFF